MKTQITKLTLLALAIAVSSCSPNNPATPNNPLSTSATCNTVGTDFQNLYAATVAQPGNSNVVTYDSEIHSYDFQVTAPKKICSLGYQSQPAIAGTPYLFEIFDNTTSTMVYSGSMVFSSLTTSFVSITPVVLTVGDRYTIRRIQTMWGTNIGNTIGRLVRNSTGNVTFPQISGSLMITGSKLYQNAGTQLNWAIPYIDIVFQ
ncbi:MAG: hypothetical protein H7174_01155 [Flavobacterium sp.]|nr:hypothetical protein [Flavobacterium sp.]